MTTSYINSGIRDQGRLQESADGRRPSPHGPAHTHTLPITIALFFDPNPRQLHSAASTCAAPADVRDVVEVAVGIGIALIDRRRQEAAVDRQRGRRRRRRRRSRPADGRSSTSPTTGSALGVIAEHLAHAPRFDGVVQQRRGAVVVDVADLLARRGPSVRSPASIARTISVAVRRHLHAVIRVAGRSRSRRSTRRSARRAPARDPRARAPPSTRLRRARSRRGRGRTAATPAPARRCSASTRRACARSRTSCRA